jgi:paxillin
VPSVNWKGSVFHDFCLVCSKCQGDLDDGVKEVDGLPCCKKCGKFSLSNSLFAGGSTANSGFCAGCGKKLTASFVNALGSKWHKECFVCTSCKTNFSGGYAVVNDLPYCAPCSQKVSSKAPSTSVNVGERKQGFTVDPKTGQKKFT